MEGNYFRKFNSEKNESRKAKSIFPGENENDGINSDNKHIEGIAPEQFSLQENKGIVIPTIKKDADERGDVPMETTDHIQNAQKEKMNKTAQDFLAYAGELTLKYPDLQKSFSDYPSGKILSLTRKNKTMIITFGIDAILIESAGNEPKKVFYAHTQIHDLKNSIDRFCR